MESFNGTASSLVEAMIRLFRSVIYTLLFGVSEALDKADKMGFGSVSNTTIPTER
ncbi:hypothetical protein D3C86_2223010 [compost metagenome]